MNILQEQNAVTLASAAGAGQMRSAACEGSAFIRLGETVPIRLARVAADVVDGLLWLRQGDDAAVFRLADDLSAKLGPTEVRFLQRAAEIAIRDAPPFGWSREEWTRVAAEAWR